MSIYEKCYLKSLRIQLLDIYTCGENSVLTKNLQKRLLYDK